MKSPFFILIIFLTLISIVQADVIPSGMRYVNGCIYIPEVNSITDAYFIGITTSPMFEKLRAFRINPNECVPKMSRFGSTKVYVARPADASFIKYYDGSSDSYTELEEVPDSFILASDYIGGGGRYVEEGNTETRIDTYYRIAREGDTFWIYAERETTSYENGEKKSKRVGEWNIPDQAQELPHYVKAEPEVPVIDQPNVPATMPPEHPGENPKIPKMPTEPENQTNTTETPELPKPPELPEPGPMMIDEQQDNFFQRIWSDIRMQVRCWFGGCVQHKVS